MCEEEGVQWEVDRTEPGNGKRGRQIGCVYSCSSLTVYVCVSLNNTERGVLGGRKATREAKGQYEQNACDKYV